MEIDHDKIQEAAEQYAEKYEPRFKKVAEQAFTDGMVKVLQELIKE